MAADIEMDDLVQRRQQASYPPKPTDANVQPEDDQNDETIPVWTWASAILLLVMSACLTIFPRLLLFISETATGDERRPGLTPLEAFLALHFGIWLAATAAALVLNIPSTSTSASAANSAPSHPLLAPLTAASLLTSFISYNTNNVGALSFIVFIGSGTIGLWGLWTILFAGSSLVSRKTGADKRTSSFLFGNKSAASVQKKEWKKGKGRGD
ncbi:hypothetical protein HGRIS_012780 [Hohenbuehelia grisea]|uniref:Uncharacterized protein n=1 Tax=Hohenbuehelia grisea TaxID=104357 RepID=A0ABR3ITI1_9AGAR